MGKLIFLKFYHMTMVAQSAADQARANDTLSCRLEDATGSKDVYHYVARLVRANITVMRSEASIRSRTGRLSNGLPQGCVLAPVLLNIYTSDMPDTVAEMVLYADDGALGVSDLSFDTVESTLE